MLSIRNFSIIAHVDHGKSTLADRLIQYCGALSDREMTDQVLDSMDLERERGITIKSQSVTLNYQAEDGNGYTFNLIDTPGHVDFSYEVSRSLAACDGALLVVDATQGVEAQSIANCLTAFDLGLPILPVLNKIDLPSADPERVLNEIEEVIGIDINEAVQISAKTGSGIDILFKKIIKVIPPPSQTKDKPARALIIDSWFNSYLGVVSLVRIVDGYLSKGNKIRVMSADKEYLIREIGIFQPGKQEKDVLCAGDVGYVIAGIKDLGGAPVGDTLTLVERPATEALPGFRRVKPRVFAGVYPINSVDYEFFREALMKLVLNDASLHFEPEISQAMGSGFRCGFLGMLHMEIIQERLEREYNLDLIITSPTVMYEVKNTDDEIIVVDNPDKLPDNNKIKEIREPIIYADILMPQEYLGNVIRLCIQKRGVQKKLLYLSKQVLLGFELPMNEVALNFFDRLKSVSRGYASFDYHFLRFQASSLVKIDILINGDKVNALSVIIHKDQCQKKAHDLTAKIKELIPRQMCEVVIQAAVGSKILSRHSVKVLRKDVTAKCYGGDITRKRKLLEKQKAGKKRMKQFSSVEIPQDVFMAILNIGEKK